MIKFFIITCLPSIFENNPIFNYGVVGRAKKNNIFSLQVLDLKLFCDKNQRVDDRLFGPDPGMLIRYDPVDKAIKHIPKDSNTAIVMLCASGKKANILDIQKLKDYNQIIFLCGRYEGIDYRINQKYNPYVLSVGDIIVSGGEIPAMLLIDAIVRLIPNVINNPKSLKNESFEEDLLCEPKYTRPYTTYDGLTVPKVLTQGNDRDIKKYNMEQKILKTIKNRMELIIKKIKKNE